MATLGLELGFPRALAVTWTGEQPLAPHNSPLSTEGAPAGTQLQAGLAVGVGGRRVGENGDTSACTRLGPITVPGWGGDRAIPQVLVPELCPAQGGIIPWPGAEPLAPAPSQVGAVCAPVPTWGHPCALIPYTGARTGAGAQGGHFSPQGLVYRPQKEPALNSRFRSAPLTSISFRKLELHNYPKPRMK